MKRFVIIAMLSLTLVGSAFAKEHSGEYQEGTVSMSALSGHEVYTFAYSDGRAGDVATREEFSADSFVTPEVVKRAAAAVPVLLYLRESANKYGQKHNNDDPEFCYCFRSHNAMGGYGDTGEAQLDEKGHLQIFDANDREQSKVYIAMMTCTLKRRLADITAEVKTALNPPPPPPSALTPEEQAKRAQQYADCLKVAVNNPSIVCKP